VPPTAGMDIRQWGATQAADIVPYMAKAYAANLGVKIIIPAGVWQVQSATTFAAAPPYFEGVGWAEHNNTLFTCPVSSTSETWLHEAVAMAATTPFTINGVSTNGSGSFSHLAICQDHPTPSTITAAIAGTTLTVSSGSVSVGQGIGGAGVSTGTVIVSGTGPYTVNNTQTVTSETMKAWKATPYAPVVTINATGGQISFDDLYMFGVDKFIDAQGTVGLNGRIGLHNIRGQVFSYLLNADNSLDTSHGSNLHLYPTWNGDTSVTNWQENNGVPLIIGRVDGLTFSDYFALGYQSCVKFITTANGSSTGSQWPGFYCDVAKFPIWVTGSNVTAQFPDAYLAGGSIPGSNAVRIENTSSGSQIMFGPLQTSGQGGSVVSIVGGVSNEVSLSSGWLRDYNLDNGGKSLLSIANGNFINCGTAPLLGGTTFGASMYDPAATGAYNCASTVVTGYVPTVTCGTGSMTLGAHTGLFQRIAPGIVWFQLDVTITAIGTCGSTVNVTLPIVPNAASVAYGSEYVTSGKMVQGRIDGVTTTVPLVYVDNTFPFATGSRVVLTGTYSTSR
jgi:hypothetical protein